MRWTRDEGVVPRAGTPSSQGCPRPCTDGHHTSLGTGHRRVRAPGASRSLAAHPHPCRCRASQEGRGFSPVPSLLSHVTCPPQPWGSPGFSFLSAALREAAPVAPRERARAAPGPLSPALCPPPAGAPAEDSLDIEDGGDHSPRGFLPWSP